MFKYYDDSNPGTLPSSDGERMVGVVPSGIVNAYKLLDALAFTLAFPDYFGRNWNALADCLGDFSWSEGKDIILIHSDLPRIPSSDLNYYLDVLREADNDWGGEEEYSFTVMFPLDVKQEVESVLSK